MASPIIALYGNDQGANDVLDGVARAFAEAGLDILRIPGLNGPVSEDWRVQMSDCAAIVLGISTSMPEARVAADLLERNPGLSGKIFFVQDFPGSTGVHDDVLRRIGRLAHLCAILPPADDAEERAIYQSVVTTGVPDHWLPAMAAIRDGMSLRRDDSVHLVRSSGERRLIGPCEIIVYLCGFKEPALEARTLQHLLSLENATGQSVIVHFRPHPGERNRPALLEAIAARDALLNGRWLIDAQEHASAFPDALLIGMSDVAIAHPGATATYLVAPLRKTMLCAREFILPKHLEESSYDHATAERTTEIVDRLADLPDAVLALAQHDSPRSVALREKQARNCLPLDPDHLAHYGKAVLDAIRRVID